MEADHRTETVGIGTEALMSVDLKATIDVTLEKALKDLEANLGEAEAMTVTRAVIGIMKVAKRAALAKVHLGKERDGAREVWTGIETGIEMSEMTERAVERRRERSEMKDEKSGIKVNLPQDTEAEVWRQSET